MSRFACFAALMLAFGASLVSAADFSSLEERMNGSEFDAAGLGKLSPDELARLNEWLRTNWPAATTAAASSSGNADIRGLPAPAEARDEIVARIDGEFRGWNGSSVFRLDNGMIWEASAPSSLVVPMMTNPTVTITPSFMGSWTLRVEGYNTTIRVKRVQ